MRIAVLYWPTTSVGGIASDLLNLRSCALRKGHTFDVYRSGDLSTIEPRKFRERKLIRGGDSFIHIDGEASHASRQVRYSADMLNRNYDIVILGFLCPHPKKEIPEPRFLELLTRLKMPIVGRVTDGYFDTYAEWGKQTLALCQRSTVVVPSYAKPLTDREITNFEIYRAPFDAEAYGIDLEAKRSPTELTIWPSQQKNIKGWNPFLEMLAEIPGDVEIYNCGIRYYQTRTSDEWIRGIGKNNFHPEFGGLGRHTYFGWQTLDHMRSEVYPRAWFMVDFQGMGKPRYEAYRLGSYNHTTVEALWYGMLPVLYHTSMNAGLPPEVFFAVEEARDFITDHDRALEQFHDATRLAQARQFVLDHHSADHQLAYLLGDL